MNVREFNYLFYRDWDNAGGLITPSTAAKLLGLTPGRMSQICEERHLRKYIYNDPSKPLLSLTDIRKIQSEKRDKLSKEARDVIDKKQAEWVYAYEEQLKKEEELSTMYSEPPPRYEEIVGSEIDDYENYMEKRIGKK